MYSVIEVSATGGRVVLATFETRIEASEYAEELRRSGTYNGWSYRFVVERV